MNKRIENQATKFAKEHGRKRQWHKALTMLAAMVVFVTTYVLIMPAVTMQGKTYCGTAEHKHSEACFAQANILVCTLSEEGHTHTDVDNIYNLLDKNFTCENINSILKNIINLFSFLLMLKLK